MAVPWASTGAYAANQCASAWQYCLRACLCSVWRPSLSVLGYQRCATLGYGGWCRSGARGRRRLQKAWAPHAGRAVPHWRLGSGWLFPANACTLPPCLGRLSGPTDEKARSAISTAFSNLLPRRSRRPWRASSSIFEPIQNFKPTSTCCDARPTKAH